MPGKAWSMLTISGRRQYAGNAGYEDDPENTYLYDSAVGNSRNVSAGDLAVLRDRNGLIGCGLISNIRKQEGEKERFRCPNCGSTAIKERVKMSPAFRCGNGHEFENPAKEIVPVTRYEAVYGSSYLALPNVLDAHRLRAMALRPSTQVSIEELRGSELASRIVSLRPDATELFARFLQHMRVEAAEEAEDAGYVPSFSDRRNTILRAIRERRGQSAFRSKLIKRYGSRCMISGCQIMEIVEAAHISPYRGEEDNAPGNGLLLRADLHTLFDLDFLAVNPDSLTMRLAPALRGTDYESYDCCQLLCGRCQPSREALSLRWKIFKEKWNGSDSQTA